MTDGFDLRTWLDQVRALGELRELSGVSAELEIGTIVDILMEKPGQPAVLFDAIPGYQPGRRVLGNVLTSPGRVAVRARKLKAKHGALTLVARFPGNAALLERTARTTVRFG